jgi:hypothetical protein
MIRVNDFLADFKAHHCTSIDFEKSDSAARAGLGVIRATQYSVGPYLVSVWSLTSHLAKRQAFERERD